MERDDVFCIGDHECGILGGNKRANHPVKIEELCLEEVAGMKIISIEH